MSADIHASQTPEPRTLDVLAHLGEHHQVAPTMAGTHLTKVTDPQHRALQIAEDNGAVHRGGKPGQAPGPVLKALGRKGYLRLTAHPGTRRHDWAYGEITPAGRRELARLNEAAAEQVRMQAIRAGQPATA